MDLGVFGEVVLLPLRFVGKSSLDVPEQANTFCDTVNNLQRL